MKPTWGKEKESCQRILKMKSSISPSCQNELKHMLILLWLCCPKNGAHVPKHTHNKISGWVLYTTSKVDVVCSSIFIQFHFEQMQVNSRWSWTIVLCCQQNLWKPSLPQCPSFFQGTMVVCNPLYAVGIGEVSQSCYHSRNTEFFILRWPGSPNIMTFYTCIVGHGYTQ